MQEAQGKYKKVYDCMLASSPLKVGDWVLVKFLRRVREDEETVETMAWAILTYEKPDITAAKVYFSEGKTIRTRVYLSRVTPRVLVTGHTVPY